MKVHCIFLYPFLRVPYLAVARTFEKIEEDSGRYEVKNYSVYGFILFCVFLLHLFHFENEYAAVKFKSFLHFFRLKNIETLSNFLRSVILLTPGECVN